MTSDPLSLHQLSVAQIDALISQTWDILSDDEKAIFTDELHTVDQEYKSDIDTLISQTLHPLTIR
jgi:hypothetical protein